MCAQQMSVKGVFMVPISVPVNSELWNRNGFLFMKPVGATVRTIVRSGRRRSGSSEAVGVIFGFPVTGDSQGLSPLGLGVLSAITTIRTSNIETGANLTASVKQPQPPSLSLFTVPRLIKVHRQRDR